mgnify:CR=1 FL=1
MAKLSRPEFIATLAPMAIQARREGSPLFPSVRLAQNLLETGGVIHPWYNLGGIKVGSGTPNAYWKGQWLRKGTWEVENGSRVDTSAYFRAYESVYHFYKDQDLLLQLPRYERVRKAGTPSAQAEALRQSGYATDPQYGAKINSLIQSYHLTRYDDLAEQPQEPAEQPETDAAVPAEKPPVLIPIRLNGEQIAEGLLIDRQTWAPARLVGEALKMRIGWKDKTVTANGQPLPTQVFDGKGYAPVRELAAISPNAKAAWNKEAGTVDLTTTD